MDTTFRTDGNISVNPEIVWNAIKDRTPITAGRDTEMNWNLTLEFPSIHQEIFIPDYPLAPKTAVGAAPSPRFSVAFAPGAALLHARHIPAVLGLC